METQFLVLIQEHREISHLLQNAKTAFASKQLESCMAFLKEFELKLIEHDIQEDKVLFSKIFDKPQLSEGGPFCTLYFDSFMSNRPLRQLVILMRKIEPTYPEPEPCPRLEKYLALGSPLAIPYEEHFAIQTLAKEIKLRLGLPAEDFEIWVTEAFEFLKNWTHLNHQKEENCLFLHAQSILRTIS